MIDGTLDDDRIAYPGDDTEEDVELDDDFDSDEGDDDDEFDVGD